MQPPLLADQRFMISGHAQGPCLKPTEHPPRPGDCSNRYRPRSDTLIRALQKISACGIALSLLWRIRIFRSVWQGRHCAGLVAPVNGPRLSSAHGAAITARAKLNQAADAAKFPVFAGRRSAYITGTKRIAVRRHAGGPAVQPLPRTWLTNYLCGSV